MKDSLKYHIPEHSEAESHETSVEAQIITHPAVKEAPLYIASYLIPQGSLCQFKQNTKDEIKHINIETSGLYSIVDFETDSAKEERSWSKTVNEDVNALKHTFGWQFVLYCISTASEIMISVSGLEYTYRSWVNDAWIDLDCKNKTKTIKKWLKGVKNYKNSKYSHFIHEL